MKSEDTIIAQCTPRGSGALALLRLSGSDALEIATQISKLSNSTSIHAVPSHTIHYGHAVNDHNEPIDQVMFLVMHAPRTFTGEDVVEITMHNNPFIIEAVIAQAIKKGARLAQEGEFCKRAVLNGKIDLVQAEAINELIHAHTKQALKQSLAQIEGSFTQWIHAIEQDLVKAIAFCQASFEFIDEEDMEFGTEIKTIIEHIYTTIEQLKITFDQQQRLKEGMRIAFIGSVNAGKSSLFNALLQKDRAIVTPIAGTTRDVIEAGIYKEQTYWTLVDTAGLRQSEDVIEQKGIDRSHKEAASADIILLVIDSSRIMSKQEKEWHHNIADTYQEKIITIYNKSDLIRKTDYQADGMSISTKNKQQVEAIEQAVKQKITALLNAIQSPFLLNKRQFNLLLTLEQKLQKALPLFTDNIAYELLCIHLQDAVAHVSELTGKTISEASMDKVFREFCVGK